MRATPFRVRNTLTDYDGSPLTPDSHTFKLIAPDGTEKGTVTGPALESPGVYYVEIATPSTGPAGTWTFSWITKKATKDKTDTLQFIITLRP